MRFLKVCLRTMNLLLKEEVEALLLAHEFCLQKFQKKKFLALQEKNYLETNF